MSIPDAAKRSTIPYGTLASWFSGRTWLDASKPSHRESVLRVCEAIGINSEKVLALSDVDTALPKRTPLAGLNLLDILLDVIENPQTPKQQKEIAKQTIREWLKEVV